MSDQIANKAVTPCGIEQSTKSKRKGEVVSLNGIKQSKKSRMAKVETDNVKNNDEPIDSMIWHNSKNFFECMPELPNIPYIPSTIEVPNIDEQNHIKLKSVMKLLQNDAPLMLRGNSCMCKNCRKLSIKVGPFDKQKEIGKTKLIYVFH